MTQKQLIDQFCEFRGKCTTDDVVALNFAYEMLMKSHWISVEDELPEVCVAVLTTTPHGTQRVGFYEDGWWLANTTDLVRMGSITHWMPLPASPKSGSSEFPNNCEKGGEE